VTLFTLIIFVTSIWSLAFYASRILREDMEHLLADQQYSTVSYVADELNHALEERVHALGKVADSIDPSMLDHPAALQKLLEDRPIFYGMFNSGVVAVSLDGTAVADVPVVAGRRGTNYDSNAATHSALTEGRSVIGRPVLGRVLRQPLFNINAPIRDSRGKVIGALFGVINLAKPNFLDRVGEHHYGKSGGYLVMDLPHKLIVTATDKTRVMQPLLDPGVNGMHDRRMQGFVGSAVAVNSQGVEVLSSASTMPVANWLVVATLPTEEALAPIRTMQRHILMVTIFLTLVAGLLTWWMLRRQLSPMLAAARTLTALSDTNQPPQPLPVVRQDEIGQLIRGFNRLLETLAQREAALKESEYRWKFALEGSGDGVWDLNVVTQEAHHSRRYQEILGYAEGEFQVNSGEWLAHLHPEDKPRLTELLQGYFDGKANFYAAEFRMRCKDGRYIWVHGRGMAATRGEDGKPLRMIGTLTDITERRQAEVELVVAKQAADKANRAKSRFLAAASHDLRQPLLALSLFVGILKNKASPDGGKLVSNIQSCVDSLSELLTDLLDVSKLEAGVIAPNPSDFVLDDLLDTLVSVHSAEAELKGLQLRWRRSEAVVRTDQHLLHRILGNLVANAIRYTSKGGVLIACRRRNGKRWVEVWDTGIGIPADKTEIIFDEFRQLGDDERNRGSGLGLAIVTKAAALLGLEIRLRSRPGRGSMFAVELPPGDAGGSDGPPAT